jgi:hypothetical protein
MRIKVSLRFYSSCDPGRFFHEDSSAFTELFLGNIQVYLDHEDFRMQLWG